MVKEILVEKDISDGKKLITDLEKSGFNIESAFWLHIPKSDKWNLFLSSTYVDEHGEKGAYEFIQKVLLKFDPPIGISLSDTNAVKTSDELVKLLRLLIRTGPGALSEIRFTENVINGVLIEDALIYRIT